MTGNSPFTADEISKELNFGIATTKFILKRFAQFFPSQPILGQKSYSPNLIPLVVQIKEHMDQGMLPSKIEEKLNSGSEDQALYGQTDVQINPELFGISPGQDHNGDIRISQDGLSAIQSLFNDIKTHQDRVALAHEQRAKAEERKAVAIEKRAEAEGKKALAMDNIAAALQEMNRQRANDIQAREIARQTAQALTLDEIPNGEISIETKPQGDETSWTDIEREKTASDTQDATPDNSDVPFQDPELDNLSELIYDPVLPEVQNLSTSLSQGFEESDKTDIDIDNLADLLDKESPVEERPLDDLSALVDENNGDEKITDKDPAPKDLPASDIDDLSLLLDKDQKTGQSPGSKDTGNQDIDDLSLLIEPEKSSRTDHPPVDDLSLLLDPAPEKQEQKRQEAKEIGQDSFQADSPGLDNLAALIEDESTGTTELDNLSALVDEPMTKADPHKETEKGTDVDDKNSKEEHRSLKPDISPEENLNAYKAAVMKIIIQLKSEGLTVKETTARLNSDRVQTLSGKPSWSEKALAKIYGFIDSAS